METSAFRIVYFENKSEKAWLEQLTHQLQTLSQSLFGISANFEYLSLNFSDWEKQYVNLLNNNKFAAELIFVSDSLFELAARHKEFSDYLHLSTQGRFVIAKMPFPEQQKMIFNEREFYSFYKTQHNNEILTFNFQDNNQMADFWLSIVDLCYELQHSILVLSGHKHAKTIYLAEVSPDLEGVRQLVKRELLRYQHKVIPENRIYASTTNLESKIEAYCKQADMVIQLLGNQQSELIPGSTETILQKQVEIAARVAMQKAGEKDNKQNFGRYLWMPPSMEPENESYAIYIESLKRDSELLFNAELLQNPLELFKSIIVKDLQKNETEEQIRKNPDNSVFVVSDNYMTEETARIVRVFGEKGYSCNTLDNLGKTLETLHAHRNYLVEAIGVVLIYQNGNKDWLMSKMKDIVKSPGFGRKSEYLFALLFYNADFKNQLPEEVDLIFHKAIELEHAIVTINQIEEINV